MGTGGILPKTITQTVSLYNTTGVIEKEKGIYFCPLITVTALNQNALVCNTWKTEFHSECTTDSNYENIDISIWNPKDRVLTIKGNADDFRCNYQNGSALNYLILSRTKTYEDESTETVYYAFFINSASQVGNGSVRLELTQDHFTDVFFLQNERPLKDFKDAKGYVDVFNDMLKQNYVLRQHYDRVEKVYVRQTVNDGEDLDPIEYEVIEVDSQYFKVSMEYEFELPEDATDLTITSINAVIYDVSDSGVDNVYYTINGNILEVIVEGQIHDYHDQQLIDEHNAQFELEFYYSYKTDVYTGNVKETNLDVFSLTEEQFKYKRQTKDYKEYINYGDPFTEEEKEEIENTEEFEDLPETLQIKVLKDSLAFVHTTINNYTICDAQYGFNIFDFSVIYNKLSNINKFNSVEVGRPQPTIANGILTFVTPVSCPRDLCKKYWNKLTPIINFPIYYDNGKRIVQSTIQGAYSVIYHMNPNEFTLSDSALSNYTLNATLTKESSLIENIEFVKEGNNMTMHINAILNWNNISYNLPRLVVLPEMKGLSPEDQSNFISAMIVNEVKYKINNESTTTESVYFTNLTQGHNFVFGIVEEYEPIEFTLDLSEPVKADSYVMNNYYEPLLSFSPYSFYSVSYLGRIETVLNKLNYYQNTTIDCELNVLPTNVTKYGFYPTYEINGKKIKYYTESLEQTITSELSVANSQLTSYLMQNKAQMKNQYAVNNIQGASNLFGSVLDTGASVLTGGLLGKIATSPEYGEMISLRGGIGGGAGIISSAINWGISQATTDITQKAKLADVGNMPDNVKQVGTDIILDTNNNELGLYLNHYSIDKLSYDSISKYLERFGYLVNIYSDLHVNTRVGWNYLQLISFDYHHALSVEQEESIRQIMQNGVTLLHRPHVLESGHNYEVMLEE